MALRVALGQARMAGRCSVVFWQSVSSLVWRVVMAGVVALVVRGKDGE